LIALSATVAVLSSIAIAMLWWTLAGFPPRGFFALQTAVLVTSLLCTSLLAYRISRRWLPMSIALVIVALVHVLGHMRRDDWMPYDIATLVLSAFGITLSLRYLYATRQSATSHVARR